MDRALARCPQWTWHHDTSVRLWYFTLLWPLAWGWPSPTLRRLTALTHFPSECQKSLGSNLSSIICVLFPFSLEVWQGSSLLMSWWFAWSWPAQIAAIYERFTGFWFWRKQTECVVMWIADWDYTELLVLTQNGNQSFYSLSLITIIFIAFWLWQQCCGAQREFGCTRWVVSFSASVVEHMVAYSCSQNHHCSRTSAV